jgi:LmbE family N-acetylglucosaminyl deacetylase
VIDLILFVGISAVLIVCVRARAPRNFSDNLRDVLICAAHSDDCVIMGAEYSYGALEKGYSVRIAYLTCSGPHPEAKISRTRNAEAVAAWSALGVPQENLVFINLRESPVRGPPSYSEREMADAGKTLKSVIASLPTGAAILIPADGESHVDHRTVRKLSLSILKESQRNDLLIYETPEYNACLSLIHCPKRTIWTILAFMPLLTWIVKPYVGPSNFINGPPGFVFRDSPNRLAKKKELLNYFPSKGGTSLIRYFGYETPYRTTSSAERYSEPNRAYWFLAFGCRCDLSVLALFLAFLTVTILTTYEVARAFLSVFLRVPLAGSVLFSFGLGLAGIYVVRRHRGTASLESSLYVWAVSVGMILASWNL